MSLCRWIQRKKREEEWLLIEWPCGESEPTKYWLSNLPAALSVKRLVDTAKMRWRIEHDYHELKQEFGLSHYEGRGRIGEHDTRRHAACLRSANVRQSNLLRSLFSSVPATNFFSHGPEHPSLCGTS